ncbi:hypothetical protein Z043_112609 [Scleropages formosus]|uniref:Ig-like domain-containing protein n=1 Tax=Scleropages formosus TaxID=113540 RepID=A0A0N8JZ92_SCLFO|nr:hypothetical protein Z043_112609 [Scleropages formosus]
MAAVGSSASTRIVTEGEPLTLSCRYSIKRYGPSSVCWGRGCGALWCSGIIVQTDGSRVVSKVSEKYRLAGDLQSGLVDLTITNVSRKDKGPYCCRVDIDGYFNDKKRLQLLNPRDPTLSKNSLPPPYPARPEPLHSTDTWLRIQPSLAVEADGVNHSSILSTAGTMEETSYQHQLQIPVLSLCLCLLFLLVLGSTALLAFRRRIHKTDFTTERLQTRRPVEENIYTLD